MRLEDSPVGGQPIPLPCGSVVKKQRFDRQAPEADLRDLVENFVPQIFHRHC
jgi:hypothetical protein